MEREKFEESCKHAFDEAGISPSAKVWTNIELELERARGGELKRRLLFYQMLAAASVVFAMAIGGAGYYYAFDSETDAGRGTIAQAEQVAPDKSAETFPTTPERSAPRQEPPASTEEPSGISGDISSSTAVGNAKDPAAKSSFRGKADTQDTGDNERYTTPMLLAENNAGNSRAIDKSVSPAAGETMTHSALPLQIEDGELPALYTAREVRLNFDREKQQVDPVVAMLAKLEQREREVQRDERDEKENAMSDERLWTSIGFAAGSFNAMQAPSASGSSGSASRLAMAAGNIVDQEAKATGYSYSMGVNLGTRISERWVFQGGVNYLTHTSEYTANSVVVDGPGFLMAAEKYKPITTNAIVSADSEYELSSSIVYSAPYNVNNSMRYISIPMQAGYLLINKTFGLQLNAGVATDLFLQNTVKGDGDQLGETTQSLGSDSPYRTVNLSGLLGTEVSYRFGPHYRVSLNPGIRYPFNTIYKSELGVQSSPLTFDVGLRFRYIFH